MKDVRTDGSATLIVDEEEIDLTDMAAALISAGIDHPQDQEEATAKLGEMTLDGFVCHIDGEEIDAETAATYLADGVVHALRVSLDAHGPI